MLCKHLDNIIIKKLSARFNQSFILCTFTADYDRNRYFNNRSWAGWSFYHL